MNWYYRWACRTVLSYIPFPGLLRHFKRAVVGHNVENAKGVLARGLSIIDAVENGSFHLEGKKVLELGSGWEPIIPLLFSLKNCEIVYMVDANRLIESLSFTRCLAFLNSQADQLGERLRVSPAELRKRLALPQTARKLNEMFDWFRLSYRAPCDARSTSMEAQSIDVITSHTVLEHIPPPIIVEILAEFNRILKNDGKTCHLIDNSDHHAQHDRSISGLNFLQFEDPFWRLISVNRLDYQNRLRHYEYLELFRSAGFGDIDDRSVTDHNADKDTPRLKLARKYRNKTVEQLSTQSFFVARKKAPAVSAIM